METADDVRRARIRAGMTVRELARASGVSAATVSRIESGLVDPSVGTYRNVMAGTGLRVSNPLSDADSDPLVIAATRYVLGDLNSISPGVSEWTERFARLGWLGADSNLMVPAPYLLSRAGRLCPLVRRRGVKFFSNALGMEKTVDRLSNAGITYAVSGPAAMSALGARATSSTPVIYVQDTEHAREAATLSAYRFGEGRPAIFIPFDGVSEMGRRDGWVTPIQAVLDGFAGSSRMPEMAERLAESWESVRVAS